MLSDDVYRSKLQATIESLRYFMPSVADVARWEDTSETGFWKIAMTPLTAGACPVELMLHATQRYDITVGSETYEDREILSLDHFVPLMQAISDGLVKQRIAYSVATGAELSRKTMIACDFGMWTAGSQTAGFPVAADDMRLVDRHFLPYRR